MGNATRTGIRTSLIAARCQDLSEALEALEVALDGHHGPLSDPDRQAVSDLTPSLRALVERAAGLEVGPANVRDLLDSPSSVIGALSIETLAAPPVQATVAEILSGRRMGSADQLRLWLRDSLHDDSCFGTDDGDPTERLLAEQRAADAARPALEAGQFLPALLDEVGRFATLQGTASTMPISGLVTMLATSRKSGCLHFRRSSEHLRFVFADGTVIATATDRSPTDQLLGELLVGRRALSPSRRAELLEIARRRGNSLGAVALEAGDITADDLVGALTVQVQARFDRVYADPDVAYAFVPSEAPAGGGQLQVNPRQLLFDSARRIDEAARP
jgi:hypothetical protein